MIPDGADLPTDTYADSLDADMNRDGTLRIDFAESSALLASRRAGARTFRFFRTDAESALLGGPKPDRLSLGRDRIGGRRDYVPIFTLAEERIDTLLTRQRRPK